MPLSKFNHIYRHLSTFPAKCAFCGDSFKYNKSSIKFKQSLGITLLPFTIFIVYLVCILLS